MYNITIFPCLLFICIINVTRHLEYRLRLLNTILCYLWHNTRCEKKNCKSTKFCGSCNNTRKENKRWETFTCWLFAVWLVLDVNAWERNYSILRHSIRRISIFKKFKERVPWRRRLQRMNNRHLTSSAFKNNEIIYLTIKKNVKLLSHANSSDAEQTRVNM